MITVAVMKIKKVSIILIKILTMKFNKNKSKVLHIKNIIAPPLAATLKIAAKKSSLPIFMNTEVIS